MDNGEYPRHILIVDDEEIIRDLVYDVLDESGFLVTPMDSGEAALDYYYKNGDSIDLVLLDIIMPGMSGVEVFKKLKEFQPDIKIILLSGYSKDEGIEELLSCSNADFMQKPISMSLLLSMIDKWL